MVGLKGTLVDMLDVVDVDVVAHSISDFATRGC